MSTALPEPTPPPPWDPERGFPDPYVRVLEPSFRKYAMGMSGVERIATGFRWAEGPVWFGDGRFLLWSDIPNNRIMRWTEETGQVSVYRTDSNLANGNTRDRQGRLVTCEHLTHRVTRTEHDGSITVLIDRFEGKRLNSPNDVVVKSDDSIWFTDPPFGIINDYIGRRRAAEVPNNVYRVDGHTGQATLVAEGIDRPNGLCFSPDETKLYIAETASAPPQTIRIYDVVDGTRLANGRQFIDGGAGGFTDGIRCDIDGNVWAGWGAGPGRNGVMVFSPEGQPIGHILLPEQCANLCFGGRMRNRLFMTASRSLYALYTNATGATLS